jgi:AraC family transcriptional regulator
MLVTNKVIWIIERNLDRALNLAELAGACGVSPFHLAHAFGETTGQSVMRYVRGRRLSEAAKALANGAHDILELAMANGYGSHEAFSRAFRNQFGVTPEAVRRAGSAASLALVSALDLVDEGEPDVASARIETTGPMLFVGLAGHHAFSAIQGIPAQWQRFMPAFGDIPDKCDPIPVGVSLAIDQDGDFEYLCAAQVSQASAVPREFVQLAVPAQRYAVFQHRDHVVTIRSTYAAIWNHWLPATGGIAFEAPILERHNRTFDPTTGLGGLEIWVPVK